MKHDFLFNTESLTKESIDILTHFDQIVADVRHLSGKQRIQLSSTIKKLSHELTDNRSSRRMGYMNDHGSISAYIIYFMWWNLVRLTRLFSNLPAAAFEKLVDDSYAVDIGSGPLTVPVALWLARPELRSKKITWYCMDISQTVLAAGEEIFLSVAAKTIAACKADFEPWKIIRVKGPLGTSIKNKASFVSCANVFNEIIQSQEMPTDFLAKKYSGDLVKYAQDSAESGSSILMIEPGDPHSARFVSLMRDALQRRGYNPLSPCPHCSSCAMPGRTFNNKNAKWCNFAFNTEDAPKDLMKLSAKSGLNKERASLSYVLCKKSEPKTLNPDFLHLRIASDYIRLPELKKSGYYACSQLGLVLAVDTTNKHPVNSELITIKMPKNPENLPIDQKSKAIIINI